MQATRWLTLGFTLLSQCAGPTNEGGEARVAPRRVPKVTPPAIGLPALVVAQVPPGTQGPVIAHFEDRSIAVFARTTDTSWQFQSAVIHRSIGRVEPPLDLGPAPNDIGLMLIKPLPTADSLLAYTHLDDNGARHLNVQLLDSDGKRRAGPVEIASSSEALQWVDVIPSARGPLVFWATRRGDRADVRTAALAADGSLRVAAHDVLSDLRAWQVAPTASGAVLAAIRAIDEKASGPIAVAYVDGTGAVSGNATTITQSNTADLDLDVVNVGGNAVVAWTDRLNGDSRLYAAAVNDRDGVVTAAYPLTPPLGDQLLTKLVAPHAQGPAYIVWENTLAPTAERRLQLAAINEKAQLGKQRASITYPIVGERPPEVVSTSGGVALLTQMPAATLARLALPQNLGLTAQEADSQVPVFAAFDTSLAITGVEPLLTSARPQVPSLAWGLDCRKDHCFTLGALATGTDVAVIGIPLSVADRAGRSLLSRGNDVGTHTSAADSFDANLRQWLIDDRSMTQRPRLAAVRVVAAGPPLADIAVARGGDLPWVSTLTYADPNAHGSLPNGSGPTSGANGEIGQASIELRGPLGETSAFAGSARLTALSAGGLAWANAPDLQERVLAFSAPNKTPQLVTVRFDRSGRKLSQRNVTHHSTSLSSISATAVSGGYFIGWIDDRAALSRAYFVRLTRTLDRKAPEQVLSDTQSNKTGLRLVAVRDDVWAVWSAARDSAARRGDIFLQRLAQNDGRALGAEQRLCETAAHSHSPQLSVSSAGVVVAFMESEPSEAQAAGIASVRVARLDEAGRPGPMRTVELAQGVVSGYGLDCGADQCRIAVAVDVGGTGQIEVAAFDPTQTTTIRTTPFIRSLGPVDESVSPVVVGNDVYWVDRSTEKPVRVMRAAVEW